MIVNCDACGQPVKVDRRKDRRYCSTTCRDADAHAEDRHMMSELTWIAGTDSWDNIAHRLGFGSAKSLSRWLYRLGENDWAARVQRVPMKESQWGRAA